ncbi:hypothetical protein L3i23_15390 [Herbiconiux sp. L3-i23]|nr:hypothetical protein L3i23_15390 [Herbiconiux sp. L3-i23]
MLLIAGNLTWFTAHVDGVAIEVQGQSAVPPLSGLALASVALAGALSLARTVLRIVLAVLQVVLGAVSAAAVLPALTDPAGASASVVTEATGIDGDRSVRAVIDSVDITAWPTLALIVAALGAVLGLVVLVTARRWPTPGRRYANAPADAGADQAAPTASPTAEDEWDALSRGDDPTRPNG